VNSDLADTDYANLRGAYGYLDVDPLTTQQELFLLTHLRGISIKASAQAAGMTPTSAYALMKEPRINVIKDFFRKQLFDDARISLEMLNSMALEAHRKSANATEEFKGIETLAKLNQIGGYAPISVIKERQERDNERDITPRSAKQLESMSEDDLLKLADFDGLEDLNPQPTRQNPQPTRREHVTENIIEGELVDE